MANILDRIASEENLTKSERKIAQVILKNPAIVVNENIAQLAKRAGVSEPSIVRFCRRFGADGYPSFKLVLGTTVSQDSIKNIESVKQGDSVSDVISKVVGQAKNSVNNLSRNLSEEICARVIDAVSQSRRIMVIAQGLSEFIAVDFTNRMLNLGFACERYSDKQSMSLAASTLRTGDVLIAISGTGENLDVICASILARRVGGVVIGLCPEECTLAQNCALVMKCQEDVVLGTDAMLSNRLSLMLMGQVIIGGVMLRRAIAMKDLKAKIEIARRDLYTKNEVEETVDDEPNDDDSSIKVGAPITTLDWHPY